MLNIPYVYGTDPEIQRTFKFNTDTITSSYFSNNLKQLFSTSGNTLYIKNFSPNTSTPFKFHSKSNINDSCINYIDTYIATANADHSIRVYENNHKGKFYQIKIHSSPVQSVCFSHNNNLILSGGRDRYVKVYSLSEKKYKIGYYHRNWVRDAKFNYNDSLIVSCGDDNTVKIFDVNTQKILYNFINHNDIVNKVKFFDYPNNNIDNNIYNINILASCSRDRSIKIFDLRQGGECIQHYNAHNASVSMIDFHKSGNYLLSVGLDSKIKIWDIRMGEIIYNIQGHNGPIYTCNFSVCGDWFVTGGSDACLMVWKSNLGTQCSFMGRKNKIKENIIKKNPKNNEVNNEITNNTFNNNNWTDTFKNTVNNNNDINENSKFNQTGNSNFNNNYYNSMKSNNKELTQTMPSQQLFANYTVYDNNIENKDTNDNNDNNENNNNANTNNNFNNNNNVPTTQANSIIDQNLERLLNQLNIVTNNMSNINERIQNLETNFNNLYQKNINNNINNNDINYNNNDINYNNNDINYNNNDINYNNNDENNNNINNNNDKYEGINAKDLREVIEFNQNNNNMIMNENIDKTKPYQIFEDVADHIEEFGQEGY